MKKILLLLTLASLLPINIISASTYSTGIGTLEFNGKCKDNRPRSKDDHFRAIEKAKLSAWQNLSNMLCKIQLSEDIYE